MGPLTTLSLVQGLHMLQALTLRHAQHQPLSPTDVLHQEIIGNGHITGIEDEVNDSALADPARPRARKYNLS